MEANIVPAVMAGRVPAIRCGTGAVGMAATRPAMTAGTMFASIGASFLMRMGTRPAVTQAVRS